ncbi:MAG: hypothetical protein RL541_1295 [Pseudomonadota bacterium]|jgi:hypothetical protein
MANNAGRLAGLAALAGAAYMMSKGKDKEAGTTDSNPTRAARPDSTEERLKTPAESIAAADKSDKSTSISTKGLSGTTTPGPDTSAPKLDTEINKPVKSASTPAPKTSAADNTTAAAIPSGVMGGARQPTSTVSSSEEGMKNYKPRRTPARPANTVSSSEEGMKNYKPRRTPPPAPFKGGQPGYDEAGRFVGGQRGYDEAGRPMKKGGTVKKMASGGMTASKRADGIASKGKTKCKMY